MELPSASHAISGPTAKSVSAAASNAKNLFEVLLARLAVTNPVLRVSVRRDNKMRLLREGLSAVHAVVSTLVGKMQVISLRNLTAPDSLADAKMQVAELQTNVHSIAAVGLVDVTDKVIDTYQAKLLQVEKKKKKKHGVQEKMDLISQLAAALGTLKGVMTQVEEVNVNVDVMGQAMTAAAHVLERIELVDQVLEGGETDKLAELLAQLTVGITYLFELVQHTSYAYQLMPFVFEAVQNERRLQQRLAQASNTSAVGIALTMTRELLDKATAAPPETDFDYLTVLSQRASAEAALTALSSLLATEQDRDLSVKYGDLVDYLGESIMVMGGYIDSYIARVKSAIPPLVLDTFHPSVYTPQLQAAVERCLALEDMSEIQGLAFDLDGRRLLFDVDAAARCPPLPTTEVPGFVGGPIDIVELRHAAVQTNTSLYAWSSPIPGVVNVHACDSQGVSHKYYYILFMMAEEAGDDVAQGAESHVYLMIAKAFVLGVFNDVTSGLEMLAAALQTSMQTSTASTADSMQEV